MKIVVFGPEKRVGAMEGENVIDLNRAFASHLRAQRGDLSAEEQADSRVPSRLKNFIAAGPAAIADSQRAVEHSMNVSVAGQGTAIVHNLKDVKIHAPWPERRIACVGGNYAAHSGHVGGAAGHHRRSRTNYSNGKRRGTMGVLEKSP